MNARQKPSAACNATKQRRRSTMSRHRGRPPPRPFTRKPRPGRPRLRFPPGAQDGTAPRRFRPSVSPTSANIRAGGFTPGRRGSSGTSFHARWSLRRCRSPDRRLEVRRFAGVRGSVHPGGGDADPLMGSLWSQMRVSIPRGTGTASSGGYAGSDRALFSGWGPRSSSRRRRTRSSSRCTRALALLGQEVDRTEGGFDSPLNRSEANGEPQVHGQVGKQRQRKRRRPRSRA